MEHLSSVVQTDEHFLYKDVCVLLVGGGLIRPEIAIVMALEHTPGNILTEVIIHGSF